MVICGLLPVFSHIHFTRHFSILFIPIVSKELSDEDKGLLKDEGIYLSPSSNSRKRKHLRTEGEEFSGAMKSVGNGDLETQWQEVKQFMDPNTQLKGVEKGRYAPKVSII